MIAFSRRGGERCRARTDPASSHLGSRAQRRGNRSAVTGPRQSLGVQSRGSAIVILSQSGEAELPAHAAARSETKIRMASWRIARVFPGKRTGPGRPVSINRRTLGCRSLGRRSLGCRSLGCRSLGCRSLGCRSLGCRSLGCRSLGCRSLGRVRSVAESRDSRG